MTCFWPDVRVLELGEPDLRAFGPDLERLFANANAPGEYRRLAGGDPSGS
jgi:hypothetical protein